MFGMCVLRVMRMRKSVHACMRAHSTRLRFVHALASLRNKRIIVFAHMCDQSCANAHACYVRGREVHVCGISRAYVGLRSHALPLHVGAHVYARMRRTRIQVFRHYQSVREIFWR